MPFFNSASPFDADVEKATNEMNTTEDWSLILDICEKVTRQPNGSKDCLKSIVKRLNHKVPFVSMQALTLLDACVNNCGRNFHLEICSRDFVAECRTLISQKAHPKVAQRLKLCIKTWAEMQEFKDDAALDLIPSFYESLKKEGHDFNTGDVPKKTTSDASQARKEEDDLAKAIALSLQESDTKGPSKSTSGGSAASLYPSYSTSASQQIYNKPAQKELRKVRSLYDFEAAEDNELTFKAGELICVLDDSDPNWWKGSNHRGEGLFPANFVTSDLSVEPEPEVKVEKKSVQFNDEVEVKTLSLTPEEPEIDEAKIDEVLNLIQNADPTGETCPDSAQMLALEEQCKAMGPLIDAELEKIDRKHANLVELNKKVMEALQMYHSLMKETPAYGYAGLKSGPPTAGLPAGPGMYGGGAPQGAMYGAQHQYVMPGMNTAPLSMGSAAAPPQPTHTYSQTNAPSSQQSYTNTGSYPQPHPSLSGAPTATASLPTVSSNPNMALTNGSHPSLPAAVAAQPTYVGGPGPINYNPGPPGMYHPPAPQQPLL